MLKSTRPAYLFPAGFLFGLAVAAIIAVTIATLLDSTLIARRTTGGGAVQPAPALSKSAPAAAAPGDAAANAAPSAGARLGPGINGFVPPTVSARNGSASAGGGSSARSADAAAQGVEPALAARGINGYMPPGAATQTTLPTPHFGPR